MLKPSKQSGSFSLVTLVAVGLLIFGCHTTPKPTKGGPRFESAHNLRSIGAALSEYQGDHGTLPAKLSDLVPRYIPLDDVTVFYVTNTFSQLPEPPSDWKTNSLRIDQYSSYAYLGTNNIHGIIVYEQTNLWKSSVLNADKVAVIYWNITEDLAVPVEKIHDWLASPPR